MKNSKETRTCIGCRKKLKKQELIRIVCQGEDVIVDFKQDIQSRGAYICKDEKCFERIRKTKALEKALKCHVTDKKYDELRGVIFEAN